MAQLVSARQTVSSAQRDPMEVARTMYESHQLLLVRTLPPLVFRDLRTELCVLKRL
jgi:hypothetical protein